MAVYLLCNNGNSQPCDLEALKPCQAIRGNLYIPGSPIPLPGIAFNHPNYKQLIVLLDDGACARVSLVLL